MQYTPDETVQLLKTVPRATPSGDNAVDDDLLDFHAFARYLFILYCYCKSSVSYVFQDIFPELFVKPGSSVYVKHAKCIQISFTAEKPSRLRWQQWLLPQP